jgi:hypothetical protein
MRRAPDEFRTAATERGIRSWLNHECSLCGYPCSYLFFSDPEHDVVYDAGCNCGAGNEIRPSSWGAVAQQYNMQSHPDTIASYAAFWGFVPAVAATPTETED